MTGIPIRTYRPTAYPAPTAVYFHGGGWMTGSIASHDFLVRKLAQESGLVFVSVDYRLAREHPFPAGLDDCLAAVVARRFRDQGRRLNAQLLLYPVIDSAGDYPSRHESGRGYLLTLDNIVTSARNYLGNRPELLSSTDVAPMRATDLSGLAPAVIGFAHHDPLRDEGLAYADKLAATGVDVFAKDYPRMIHTFASLYDLHRCEPGAARTAHRVQPSSTHPRRAA